MLDTGYEIYDNSDGTQYFLGVNSELRFLISSIQNPESAEMIKLQDLEGMLKTLD